MKEILYSVIVILPPFILIGLLLVVFFIAIYRDVTRLERFGRWVAINVFSGIMKATKAESNQETRWLLDSIDLTEEKKLLSNIFNSLISLFTAIFGGGIIIFWQFLLIDATYSCDDNDSRKDCFEYKLWKTKAWSRDPIDCKSDAVQNGNVQVVCYKLTFNVGLASGASYGVFKLAMAVLNVATTLMLMAAPKGKTVRVIKAILTIILLAVIAAFIAIQATSLRVSFVSGNLVIIVQIIVLAVTVFIFAFHFPWNDLIAIKVGNNEQAANVI